MVAVSALMLPPTQLYSPAQGPTLWPEFNSCSHPEAEPSWAEDQTDCRGQAHVRIMIAEILNIDIDTFIDYTMRPVEAACGQDPL